MRKCQQFNITSVLMLRSSLAAVHPEKMEQKEMTIFPIMVQYCYVFIIFAPYKSSWS